MPLVTVSALKVNRKGKIWSVVQVRQRNGRL